MFGSTVTACTPGSVLAFTITYPTVLPPGTQYWKFGRTPGGGANDTPHWYVLPAVISGNTVTFSITDGGLGDDDLLADGTVVDPGGPGALAVHDATAVPTLNEWALALLSLLLFVFAMQHRRRPR